MEQGESLIQHDWCPNKKRKTSGEDRGTLGEQQVVMKAEIKILQLQAKEHQELPVNYQKLERDKQDSPLKVSKRA